jgi:hypothetical protein
VVMCQTDCIHIISLSVLESADILYKHYNFVLTSRTDMISGSGDGSTGFLSSSKQKDTLLAGEGSGVRCGELGHVLMDEVLRCRGDPLPGCITMGADSRRGLELLDLLRGFRTIVAVRASIGMI